MNFFFKNTKLNRFFLIKKRFDFLFIGNFSYILYNWVEYNTSKLQYFLGICLKIRKSFLTSLILLRCSTYKTFFEIFCLFNSPLIFSIYSFPTFKLYKRANCFFLRRKSVLFFNLK